MGGLLIYKCRRCGKLNKNTHVPDGLMALSCLIISNRVPKGWGSAASVLDMCSCEDGNIGVSDLIGFEEDKK